MRDHTTASAAELGLRVADLAVFDRLRRPAIASLRRYYASDLATRRFEAFKWRQEEVFLERRACRAGQIGEGDLELIARVSSEGGAT